MTEDFDYLAAKIRTLILEIDKLGYVFNEISEKYLERYAEDEDVDHPIRKLSVLVDVIAFTNNDLAKALLEDNILDPSFRRALQKLATMDRLKNGKWESEFVSFVNKHVKD